MSKKEKVEYQYVVPLIRGEFNLEAIREFRFIIGRKWAFDYGIPAVKLAIEIEGGIWIGGGHTTGQGFAKNLEKYNEATILGWHLLRFTPKQVVSREYLDKIRQFLYNQNKSSF